MTRAFGLCAALLAQWLFATATLAQPVPAVGDLPTGDGSVSGRISLAGGGAAADVDVSLIAFEASGSQGLRRMQSDASGGYRFEGVAADPSITYFVVAESGGVHHSQRTAFAAGEPNLTVDVAMAPQSADTARARRGDSDVRVERSCSGLRVSESHALTNRTRSVLFVPEAEREGARPILELELPAAAGELTSPFGSSPAGLVREGRRVRFWGPLYPGEQKLEFVYTLVAQAGVVDAAWRHPAGARKLTLVADPGVADIEVAGLVEVAPREVFSRSHRAFEGNWLAAGADVALSAQVGDAPALARISEAQLWIELDDAALAVDERIALEPLADASAASLLCIQLPPEASDLRFSQSTLSLPIARDPSGALEVRGPLAPGEQLVGLRYRLPVQGDSIDFERRFGAPVALLSLLVSDTGVLPETSRLHRRRPVRRVERNYLHLEAFEVKADETIDVRFSRLAAPQALPRSATVGFAALVAVGLLVALGGPLRKPGDAQSAAESEAERLAAERESVYLAVRDVDEDFDTGKLSAEDHAALREELRTRAVRLLEAERAAAGGSPQPEPREAQPAAAPETAAAAAGAAASPHSGTTPVSDALRASLARPYAGTPNTGGWRFCPQCGGELPTQPRFCPHCGERVPGAGGGA